MDITLMLIYAIFFSITSIFLLIYLKRLRNVNFEYMGIKRMLEDVIFSFNKDLQKIEGRFQELSRKVDVEKLREEVSVLLNDFRGKIDDLIKFKDKVSVEIEKLKEEVERLSAKYDEIRAKSESLNVVKDERKLGFYEDKSVKSLLPKIVEKNKAPIPLTATELKVLEILAEEGEKTVPEIKDRIGLTREHTARLMKSLYERGYVERISNKVPYVYRLAKEMEEIIKKKE